MDTPEKFPSGNPPQYAAGQGHSQQYAPQAQQQHAQYPAQSQPQYHHMPPAAQMATPQMTPQPQYQQPHAEVPMSASHQHVQYPHQHPHPPQPQAQNRDMALHNPSAHGQMGGEWQADLCDCSPCSSCMLAWCLPCILVGNTSERIRDPTMQSADMLNSDCLIYGGIACFTGCQWIYGMMKRSEIRERYNIPGSGFKDCCVSYWCPCCAIIQQDNEVRIRQKNAQPTMQGYQSQPDMQMPPVAHAK
ncbi:Uu.00g013040.m01.CDS01 [Anthostomella pinea]|uniref:Uu.00g013040.m01.CDS01 n=1 Tax=Anthostomella pinea TaxID=933095 RepID=A0AAI8VYZ3_9PEZI|nr:Uu.00g013040.m01.CDS01 [Anthostomella pinea]